MDAIDLTGAGLIVLMTQSRQNSCYIAAFTPGYMLPDTSCIHLYPLVAVNMFLVSATKLWPVCVPSVAGYKVTSRP